MHSELLRLASRLAERGEPFAIATVVTRRAPSSSSDGDMAIVTGAGEFHGFVGGSCTRPTVLEQARAALDDGRPRLIALSPDPSGASPAATVFPMTCHSGGSVEIHIQPVLPPPRLLVYGITPTARALVRLGAALGYRVWAIDPGAEPAAFPEAQAVYQDAAAALPDPAAREVFAVVATQGEWDEEATLAALAHSPSYLGVVTSATRAEELRGFLERRASAEQGAILQRLRAPAGLRIGAQRGEEIALSILAEVVEQRAASRTRARPAAPAPETAVDPVCGMSVNTATGKHRAEHQGRTYYFCCAGCRERFVTQAERFVQA
jgi:xanthine dehydrogenase accessory factor